MTLSFGRFLQTPAFAVHQLVQRIVRIQDCQSIFLKSASLFSYVITLLRLITYFCVSYSISSIYFRCLGVRSWYFQSCKKKEVRLYWISMPLSISRLPGTRDTFHGSHGKRASCLILASFSWIIAPSTHPSSTWVVRHGRVLILVETRSGLENHSQKETALTCCGDLSWRPSPKLSLWVLSGFLKHLVSWGSST